MYNGRRYEEAGDNGFIYPLMDAIITFFCWLNFPEWFKFLSTRIVERMYRDSVSQDELNRLKRRVSNRVVDLLIVLKVLYICLIILKNGHGAIFTASIVYLALSNSFTYFYYHVWEKNAVLGRFQTLHRVRRRFLNFLISIVYLELCYTYLYGIAFTSQFLWLHEKPNWVSAFLYSMSNTIPAAYSNVSPITQNGRILTMSETVFVFFFVVVVLARSLPMAETKDQ